jgi:hypothetical protein
MRLSQMQIFENNLFANPELVVVTVASFLGAVFMVWFLVALLRDAKWRHTRATFQLQVRTSFGEPSSEPRRTTNVRVLNLSSCEGLGADPKVPKRTSIGGSIGKINPH